MILAEYQKEFGTTDTPLVVHVSTPSFAGTHMEGFNAAVREIIEQLTIESEPNETINLLSGFISTADIRYLKDVCKDFDIDATILPDCNQVIHKLPGLALRNARPYHV